jgi:hypothetical protein
MSWLAIAQIGVDVLFFASLAALFYFIVIVGLCCLFFLIRLQIITGSSIRHAFERLPNVAVVNEGGD